MAAERVILHSDMNNFYASVESKYRPEFRDRPMAVCGDPKLRHGIILAKNELAKRYGVKTGEPIWQAVQKCPELVFSEPHYDRYSSHSKMAREIYEEYTDQVESFGLDECWLDVTGSTGLFGEGVQIADKIRNRIRAELGLTVSIGVSFNKVFAKLGSDLKKPDAITKIDREDMKQRIWPLPVESLLYVGNSTKAKLAKYGIETIGELATSPPSFLQYILGKNGVTLWNFANGYDRSPVADALEERKIKSIGNSMTAPRDLSEESEVKIVLCLLCENVAARLRKHDLVGTTLQLQFRDNALLRSERQTTLRFPTANAEELLNRSLALYREAHLPRPLRSLGVRVTGLSSQEFFQLSLLPEEQKLQKLDRLERAVEGLRDRYGRRSVQRGMMFTDLSLSRLDPEEPDPVNLTGFQGFQG